MTVETFNASTTWTCPAGVTSVQVECWGAGGVGGKTTNDGGGGGGGYARKDAFASTPSTGYTVSVGTGGVSVASPDGGPSYFNTSGTVQGGGGSGNSGAFGGSGGSGTGDTVHNGGNAGDFSSSRGGGGGSSAGTAAAGANGASGAAGGAGGTAPSGGGNGGQGQTGSTTGGVGSAPGGGGGGVLNGSPGFGAAGRVTLTYTADLGPPLSLVQSIFRGIAPVDTDPALVLSILRG